MTCNHIKGPSGYLDWHLWAEKMIKRGLKQTKCLVCGLFQFNNKDKS